MKAQNSSVRYSRTRKQGWLKRFIALLTLLSFLGQPALVGAQVVADPNAGSNKPRVDATANGLPLVQITDPSAAGVSRNQYQQFNVDKNGVILNNSLSLTLTQQAGYVDANPFLTKGPARIILNEVTGAGLSSLQGYTEVAGSRAEVVIANPNGITCDGCGFINASRGVLTTGVPVFGGTGSLDAFRVTGGNITVQGAGLNANNIDQVDLISRAVNINAGLWANNLHIVTGSNLVNYTDLSTQPITPDDPTPPEFSIDVAALGGMYANKIRLIGTESGVGVRNLGTISSEGDFTLTSAGQITNNSRIYADQLTMNATSLINDGPDAVIATRNENGAANFFIRDNLTNSNGAWIYSMGDIVIAGSPNLDPTASVLNESAFIEAGRDITISAGTITNKKRVFTTDEILDPTLTKTFTDVVVPTPEPVGIKYVTDGYISATASYVETTEVTRVTADSPSGQILAGWNMALTAHNVNNEYSTIAAGSNLAIDVTGALNNIGRGGFNVTTDNGTETLIYTYKHETCRWYGCYTNWPEETRTLPYPVNETATQNTFLPGAANITAGGTLTVNAGSINNMMYGPGNTTASTPINGTSIVSGTTVQPNLNVIPPTGIFQTNSDPDSHYLIETDPRFTDLRNFMSSDYMLERLAYDPERVQKRLGDGFYEQKLVLNEITQATGRRFLENYASAEDQYRALMDAGVTYAKAFDLRVGVGLTAEQMAQLTSDMVWLVEKEVQGQKVLAPVVYLSQLHANDLTPNGALIAARDIELKSASNLTNSGIVKAGDRTQIFASNIVNLGGMIDAGSSTELTATQDIINTSGTISGGSVALTAGRDIKNETFVETINVSPSSTSTKNTDRFVAKKAAETATTNSGAYTFTRVGQQGTIESRGDLTATASRDIVMAGSRVKAEGNAALDAGRNIQVGSVEQKEHIAVFFGDGFYERANTTNLASTIQAGGNLSMTAKNDATFAGTQVSAGNDITLLAGGNVALTAVKDRALLDSKVGGSGNYVRARTDNETVIGTSLLAGDNVFIGAIQQGGEAEARTAQAKQSTPERGNVLIEGSSITSRSGAITLAADNDITIKEAREYHESLTETRQKTEHAFSSKTVETRDFVSEDLVKGSTLSGGAINIVGGKDITIQSNSIAGSESLTLTADNAVIITAATDVRHEEHERREKKSGMSTALNAALSVVTGGGSLLLTGATSEALSKGKQSSSLSVTNDETVVGASLLAGGRVTITAGQLGNGGDGRSLYNTLVSPDHGTISVTGSSITSQGGAITLAAENDITIKEAREHHDSLTQTHEKTTRTLSSKTTDTRDLVKEDLAVGSALSGDTVTIASGKDLTVQGSSVVGSSTVVLAAVENVNITTAQETIQEEHERSVKKSGFSVFVEGGRAGIFLGTDKQKTTTDTDIVNNVGSTIGSVSGNVEITAGKDARIIGSEVISATGTDITAKNVAIESAYNTMDSTTVSESKRSGLTLDAGSTLTEAAGKIYDSSQRAKQVDDGRLKALYEYRAASTVNDTYQDAEKTGLINPETKDFNPGAGANIGLGYTTSRSKTVTETHSSTAVGSQIITSGDLNIKATGSSSNNDGDVTVFGSILQGKNISLEAARDILLQSAENTYDSTTTSRSSSGGLGVKFGYEQQENGEQKGGLSVYANVAGSKGNTDEHDITYTETQITAQENLSMQSGRDTTLKGAQARANAIIANVGRNLSLESEQDTSTYRGRNQSMSAGGSYALAGNDTKANFSYMQGKTDSDYRSVIEQTGLFAGAGGFDITVGKNTDLKGAVIASTAEADKNKLSTDTLTYSNIENKAEYSTSTIGVSLSSDSKSKGIAGTGMSGVPIVGVSSSGKDSNTTLAAISPATIEIRGNKDQDLSTLSRDSDKAHQALAKIFDKKKVEEQQELAKVFGEEAFKLVGDIAKAFTKPYEEAQNKLINAKLDVEIAKGKGDEAALAKANTELTAAMGEMKANQAAYDTWKDGSALMTGLHTVVGGIQAKWGGGNAFSGATGAGLNEAAIPIADNVFAGMPKDEQNALRQWTSVVIGGAAAKLTGGNSSDAQTGAATALDGEKYNRQLHQREIDRAKQYAKQYQKWVKDHEGKDITEDEAEGRLMRQMLRWADYETATADQGRDDRTVASFFGTLVLTTAYQGKLSYLTDIDMVTRDAGKQTIQVTDEEYRNPHINENIKLLNPESYARGEAQSDSGLTTTDQILMMPSDLWGVISDTNKLANRYGGMNSLSLIIGSSGLTILGSELDKIADNKLTTGQQFDLTVLKTITTVGEGTLGMPLTLERQGREFEEKPSLSTLPILGELGRNIGDSTGGCVYNFSLETCSQMAGAFGQGFLVVSPFLGPKVPASPMTVTSDSATVTMTTNLPNITTTTASSVGRTLSTTESLAADSILLYNATNAATRTAIEPQTNLKELQTSLVPYNPEFAVQQLVKDGKISIDDLQLMVREDSQNEFIPSKNIQEGEKYNYTINGTKVEIKWHSEDLNAAQKYPGSNSGSGWTAQIKVDGKLLGQDGLFYDKPDNITHIPVTSK